MPPYSDNIPLPNTSPSADQPLMRDNFEEIGDAIARNHITLGTGADSGRHVIVEMQEQSSDPTPLAAFGQVYTRDDAGTQNLFFQNQSDIFQLNVMPTGGANFVQFGDFLFQFGSLSAINNQVINFPQAFSAVPSVQITVKANPQSTTHAIGVGANPVSITSFTYRQFPTAPGVVIMWFAMGAA